MPNLQHHMHMENMCGDKNFFFEARRAQRAVASIYLIKSHTPAYNDLMRLRLPQNKDNSIQSNIETIRHIYNMKNIAGSEALRTE